MQRKARSLLQAVVVLGSFYAFFLYIRLDHVQHYFNTPTSVSGNHDSLQDDVVVTAPNPNAVPLVQQLVASERASTTSSLLYSISSSSSVTLLETSRPTSPEPLHTSSTKSAAALQQGSQPLRPTHSPSPINDLPSATQTLAAVPSSIPPSGAGNTHHIGDVSPYIQAILDRNDTHFPRLECPVANSTLTRYNYLRSPLNASSTPIRPRYYFALDLHETASLLPRLLGTIVETIKFLGPKNCVLSIVEGRSKDGTLEILKELTKNLKQLEIRYILQTSDLDPHHGNRDRIDALAELRNLALKDLYEHPDSYAPDTTVIFSNDVSLCMEDILELVHQRIFQGADMTCAMDWFVDPDNFRAGYYDLWVGRDLTGEMFMRISDKQDEWLDMAAGLFFNDPNARARFDSWRSLQVFACWNGIVAFTAEPLMKGEIKFRSVGRWEGKECYQSEPNFFAKDMWYHGHGKIAVVPTVNVAYSDEDAKRLRKSKGYVSQHVSNGNDSKIEWQATPPAQVLCLPDYFNDQVWLPWDEGLPKHYGGNRANSPESRKSLT